MTVGATVAAHTVALRPETNSRQVFVSLPGDFDANLEPEVRQILARELRCTDRLRCDWSHTSTADIVIRFAETYGLFTEYEGESDVMLTITSTPTA